MRHRRHRGALIRAALLGLTALAAGACAHNDVLVFGTSTTIGLNIETASAQGAAPSIVLGYEREEAVWMPLSVNGWGARMPWCGWWTCPPVNGTTTTPPPLYQSKVDQGGGRNRTDAYSVFASLGAKFSADADEGAEVEGGLAQFFATGGAAVAVAENEALVSALKLGEGEAQQKAVAAAAFGGDPDGFRAYLGSQLTESERAAQSAAGVTTANATLAQISAIEACSRRGGGWRLPDIAAKTVTDVRPQAAALAARSWEDVRTALEGDDGLRAAFLKAAVEEFQCQGA